MKSKGHDWNLRHRGHRGNRSCCSRKSGRQAWRVKPAATETQRMDPGNTHPKKRMGEWLVHLCKYIKRWINHINLRFIKNRFCIMNKIPKQKRIFVDIDTFEYRGSIICIYFSAKQNTPILNPHLYDRTNQLLDLGPGDSTDVAGLGSLGLGSRERPAWQGVESGTHGSYGFEKMVNWLFHIKTTEVENLENTCLTYLNKCEANTNDYETITYYMSINIEKLPVSAERTFKTKSIHIFRCITVNRWCLQVKAKPNAHMSVKCCNARAKPAITYNNHHWDMEDIHV